MHLYCEICYSIIDIYIAETTQSNHFKTYLNDYCTSFSDIWTEMWCFCLCECSRMWSGFRDLFCGRIVRRVKSYVSFRERTLRPPISPPHTKEHFTQGGFSGVSRSSGEPGPNRCCEEHTICPMKHHSILPIIQSWNYRRVLLSA